MRDDDFDQRRLSRSAAFDGDVGRPRVPGKQTLVEAAQGRSVDPPSGPGKRTLAQGLDGWNQGLARDPVAETEFHARKARELIAALRAQPSPVRERVLRADLRCHVQDAERWAGRSMDHERGPDAMSLVIQLTVEVAALETAKDTQRDDPTSIAKRGVEGPGVQLPHYDTVQRLFGAHDLSGVRAHVGGAAGDASRELGAHAYAHGNDIAFAVQPTPALVAHEATHVIQQRAGVSLKSIDGGASDAHEQQADAVADAIVRGESAAPILDAIPRGGGGTAAVQRKSGDAPTQAAHDDGPPTVKAPHAKWPVFSENGLPYKIESHQPPVRFWTVSDWVRAGAGFLAHGTHAISPACAAEIIRALGWVQEDRVESAAKNMVFDISRRVVASEVSASAFKFLGMPTSAPIVSRAGRDTLYVATRLDDPNIPAGTPVEADDAQRLRVIRALSEFTGLAPDPNALDSLRKDERLREFVVQNGVLLWEIDREVGNGIFGYDETSDDSGPFTRWLQGKQDKHPPKSDGRDKEKLKLQDFYGEPIPGVLKADRDLIETGHPIWLGIDVTWPKNYPSAADYVVVPMVTPGHLGGETSLLKCDWHIELVDSSGAPASPSAPAAPASAASSPANSAAPISTGSTSAQGTASSTPSTSTSAASSGGTAHTDVAELHHAFVLPPGQERGTFRVTVQASFDEYFEPREFTKTIEARSTAAAMKQLGDEAFADLGARETSRSAESFKASGTGDDNHGYRTTGELPRSFKPSTLDGSDARATARDDERKRLEATRVYLQANGARDDVLAAVDREIAASRATEAALASDRDKGWQPFQIRGTYLSREDGVPSGALTLYGSVHAETAPGLEVHHVKQTPDRGVVVVQIRDLSRRFDNEDMTFTGRGDTFESALKGAFTDNAKAYPKGVMAVEAEAIDARVDGGQAAIGKGTGKTIGFELGTDSRWKRFTAEVWSPVVNIATNLGAMALMAFVPGSAVLVAPLLITYNSVPAVDRLKTESERGTLTLGTAATSVGEIALNLLPLVGKAKAFTREWFLIEGANWGGQAVLMTASAIQTARALQSQDVEALAAMYEELQRLELSGADPAAIEQKRRDIMKRAKAVSDRIEEALGDQIATNAMFAVAGSVIHNAGSEHQRDQLIDAYLNKRGGSQGEGGAAGVDPGATTDAGRTPGARTDDPNRSGNSSEVHERASAETSHADDRPSTSDTSKPPPPPSKPPGGGAGPGAPPGGPAKQPHDIASADETALISGAVADRGSSSRPGAVHAPDERVASDFLSDDQVDARRWQYSALEEDPRGRALLSDPTTRHWCDLWMSMPDGITADANGAVHVKFPHGIPPEIAAKLQAVVAKGNIGLMTRASSLAERIAQAVPAAELDPSLPTWKVTRRKLVDFVGEAAVEKFEHEKTGRPGTAADGPEKIQERIGTLISDDEISGLLAMVPGAEVYLTGSIAQPSKRLQQVSDVDVFVVVADNMPEPARRQLESRLHGYKLKTRAHGELAADIKVMTASQFAGLSMLETPGRTPLNNARIDHGETTEHPGTGASGVDVHNHVMGVTGVDYFINRVGGGSAVNLLEKAFALVHDPDLKPTVQAELGAAYADVKNARAAGMPVSALEARARRGLERVLAASEQVPFDHTYDLRDLLVQRFIDPSSGSNPKGRFENFATDAIKSLHDEGVTSSEQSVSVSKLNKRFDEATMRKAHERAQAEGKDSELEFLAMLPTDKVLSADNGQTLATRPTDSSGKPIGPSYSEQVESVLARKDVRGIDFAGPEKGAFTEQGKENFKETIRIAAKASLARHESIVVRPHVGEGYDPQHTGDHVEVAQKNLDALLNALDEIGYRGPDSGVIVRFGHATHATPAQLAHIQRLRVIVEANVGSNLATGSILRVEDHPLLQNMYYGVSTMLATDGQGVMSTTLPAEYQRAAELVQRFRSGRASLVVEGRTIHFSQLKPDEQARFSVQWLTAQVASYSQVKHHDGGEQH